MTTFRWRFDGPAPIPVKIAIALSMGHFVFWSLAQSTVRTQCVGIAGPGEDFPLRFKGGICFVSRPLGTWLERGVSIHLVLLAGVFAMFFVYRKRLTTSSLR